MGRLEMRTTESTLFFPSLLQAWTPDAWPLHSNADAGAGPAHPGHIQAADTS